MSLIYSVQTSSKHLYLIFFRVSVVFDATILLELETITITIFHFLIMRNLVLLQLMAV